MSDVTGLKNKSLNVHGFIYTPKLVGHTAFGLLGVCASCLFIPHLTLKPCMLGS